MAGLSLVEVLDRTSTYFAERGIPKPKLEAQLVLGHILEMDRLALFMNFDRPLNSQELEALRDPVGRRAKGEPLAWILGNKEFWSLDFKVGPGVLIPRPDTETLVEQALAWIGEDEELFVADVCAGSGCVGLSIAHTREQVKVYCTELSEDALPYLKANVEALGLQTRAAVLRGSLLAPIPADRPVDIVVSNPPYIARGELQTLEVARFEPALALDGGPDGLDVYRVLIPAAAARARVGVLVEIGYDQGEAVKALFESAGLTQVEVVKDLSGHDRVVKGRVA